MKLGPLLTALMLAAIVVVFAVSCAGAIYSFTHQ